MDYTLRTEADLHKLFDEPYELVRSKSVSYITEPIHRFIELSPFLCLGTHNRDGGCDISPRGDAPGFVHVHDRKTLIIPDRPGNRRFDAIVNIINQPWLSLIFMILSVLDTVRVNGKGSVSTDPEWLKLFPVGGKTPKLVIVVDVIEALGHCSKALRRAKLWERDYVPTKPVPSLADLITNHLPIEDSLFRSLEDVIEEDAKCNMY